MKKILTIALLLSVFSFATMAQDGAMKGRNHGKHSDKKERVQQSPEEIAKRRTDRLDKELKLTDSQRKEVYAIQLKDVKFKNQTKESRQKEHQNKKANRKASKEALNKILTPEQQQLMAEKTAKKGDKAGGKSEGGRKHKKNRSNHGHQRNI